MTPLEVAQAYFKAWNRHDAAGIVNTFAESGTYVDSTSGGELTGDAIGAYAEGLWSAFPDLFFDIVCAAEATPGLVAAQWTMRGVHSAPFMGLPPTGRTVVLPGADFIDVEDGKIRTVRGYFDSRALPDQLGLQVLVQPHSAGPFAFGSAVTARTGKTDKPGAFSITMLRARNPEEIKSIREQSRQIVQEMMEMPGFIGFLGAVVGDRMITVTAWDDPENSRQLMWRGTHAASMRSFFGSEIAAGGFTSVWVPARINPRWVRCQACGRMIDHERAHGACTCGEALPRAPEYF